MSHDGDRPPAPASSDQPDTPGESCEHCGTAIDTTDWYPVAKGRDADGTLLLYPFCSEHCKDGWRDGRPD